MSVHENEKPSSEKGDVEDDKMSDKSDSNKPRLVGRMVGSSYDTMANATSYRSSNYNQYNESGLTRGALDALKNTNPIIYSYPNSTTGGDLNSGKVVFTKNAAETERYLSSNGIDLCKNPNIIRRTINDKPIEYERRVCLRYLQPPPAPRPGPLIIEQVEKPTSVPSPLIIREQPAILDSPAPLILRERPPPLPPAIPTERRVEYVSSGVVPPRSVIIERYPTVQERPRDVIIERWLPYGRAPEREVKYEKVSSNVQYPKPTCTIINYESPNARVNQKFSVVDVYNADPNDYIARYSGSLLDSKELLEEARRVGVVEDTNAPSLLSVDMRFARKTVDYQKSRDMLCECFPSERTTTGESNYFDAIRSTGYTNTSNQEYRTQTRSFTNS